ncbi:MAG TPA: pyridoxamine 5'-phosphate oxidase family protein [Gaiellaceae bacterium]|nr:pyridoxamine 5'-phosphate oxidase family protein [Gaiellaceae bacterium]
MIAELDRAEIDDLLHTQVVGRVGCHADGLTYVVPVIYAYDGEAFYVYTVEGKKVRMMRANPQVCFEVDEYERGSWRSAIVQGRYEELDEAGAERALALLAARFPSSGSSRRPRAEGTPVAFRIVIDGITGRTVRREPAG